jgi:hypothetical protein
VYHEAGGWTWKLLNKAEAFDEPGVEVRFDNFEVTPEEFEGALLRFCFW